MPHFHLSTESTSDAPRERWKILAHSGINRPAFIIGSGECVNVTPPLILNADSCLLIRYGLAYPNQDGSNTTAKIMLARDHQPALLLAELTLSGISSSGQPREATFDLAPFAGEPIRIQLAAPANAGTSNNTDSIALHELVVAPSDEVDAVRARAFNAERSANELAHFQHVYQHHIYARQDESSNAAASHLISCLPLATWINDGLAVGNRATDETPKLPLPAEIPYVHKDAYHYAHELLTLNLKSTPPNYPHRLQALGKDKPLRILSLCSGAARIEATFAATPGIEASWTLMDINDNLLKDAAAAFPEGTSLELVVGNLNEARFSGRTYDIILCVSGLHHIVELENVCSFISDSLDAGGEFWSIGEAIGRNGNRLWPRDYAVANAFFRNLPERLRRNRVSGQIDRDLPSTDFSEATFEGIRSQDIEAMLSRRLEPVHLYRRNCFLWRVVDLAYADNYDLDYSEDIHWLQSAVVAELNHFRSGGLASEMHAVYRKLTV